MKTITVQIGNTDNKLTQQQWAEFVRIVHHVIYMHADERIHFAGASPGDAAWQNYCWVFSLHSEDALRRMLADAAKRFSQDSIAYTVGDTEFITP